MSFPISRRGDSEERMAHMSRERQTRAQKPETVATPHRYRSEPVHWNFGCCNRSAPCRIILTHTREARASRPNDSLFTRAKQVDGTSALDRKDASPSSRPMQSVVQSCSLTQGRIPARFQTRSARPWVRWQNCEVRSTRS